MKGGYKATTRGGRWEAGTSQLQGVQGRYKSATMSMRQVQDSYKGVQGRYKSLINSARGYEVAMKGVRWVQVNYNGCEAGMRELQGYKVGTTTRGVRQVQVCYKECEAGTRQLQGV